MPGHPAGGAGGDGVPVRQRPGQEDDAAPRHHAPLQGRPHGHRRHPRHHRRRGQPLPARQVAPGGGARPRGGRSAARTLLRSAAPPALGRDDAGLHQAGVGHAPRQTRAQGGRGRGGGGEPGAGGGRALPRGAAQLRVRRHGPAVRPAHDGECQLPRVP